MNIGLNGPVRMCMGCAGRAPQRALIRVSTIGSGELVVADRDVCGRSGYLHAERSCWLKFAARKGLLRSLGRSVGKDERVAFLKMLELAVGPNSEVSEHVA